ncbi:unnamed protein product [Pylaiella littoralis]
MVDWTYGVNDWRELWAWCSLKACCLTPRRIMRFFQYFFQIYADHRNTRKYYVLNFFVFLGVSGMESRGCTNRATLTNSSKNASFFLKLQIYAHHRNTRK